jgi:hypothetical protein
VEAHNSWWSHFKGDHAGIIIQRRNWIYFLGMNRLGSCEPTLLVVQYLNGAGPIFGGHASLLGTGGPATTAVVIADCPAGTTLRAAVKASHAYSAADPAIDPFIADALERQCDALSRRVQPLKPYAHGRL